MSVPKQKIGCSIEFAKIGLSAIAQMRAMASTGLTAALLRRLKP
jgi:hypothetical protein